MWKVLIVDDDLLILEDIDRRVDWQALGCRIVATATDGIDAMEKIERFQPDIVFADVIMPRMDGIELLQKMREEYPHIHMVMMSAFDEAIYVRQSLHFDALEYLIKPYDEPQVRRVLEKIKKLTPAVMLHSPDNLGDEVYNGISKMAQEVLERLEHADPAGVEKKVNQMFDQIEAQKMQSMLFLTSTCVDMLTKGINMLKQILPEESPLEIHGVLDMVSRVRDVGGMRNLMLRSMKGMAHTMLESGSEMSRIVRNVCYLIREEYNTNITIQQIADRMHVSVNYLQSQFKRDTGTTIRQYVTDMRVEQAKRLLRQTNDKVADICQQVGYKDVDYFVHIFRESTGTTPNDYRKSGK